MGTRGDEVPRQRSREQGKSNQRDSVGQRGMIHGEFNYPFYLQECPFLQRAMRGLVLQERRAASVNMLSLIYSSRAQPTLANNPLHRPVLTKTGAAVLSIIFNICHRVLPHRRPCSRRPHMPAHAAAAAQGDGSSRIAAAPSACRGRRLSVSGRSQHRRSRHRRRPRRQHSHEPKQLAPPFQPDT